MVVYCVTYHDGIACTLLTNAAYTKNFASKCIDEMVWEFRENNEKHLDGINEDQTNELLVFSGLDDLFEKWQDPEEADERYKIK